MPTLKQKRVARRIVAAIQNNEDITAGEILKSSDYSATVQKVPNKVIESEGVKEELANYGFSLEAADNTVAEILHKGQQRNRLTAADMVYKRLSGYAPEKQVRVNVEASIKDKGEIEALRAEFEEKLKAKLIHEKGHKA